jgi:hypothetical protein
VCASTAATRVSRRFREGLESIGFDVVGLGMSQANCNNHATPSRREGRPQRDCESWLRTSSTLRVRASGFSAK